MVKISLLQREGVILNLRREIYLCLPEEGEGTYSRELVAIPPMFLMKRYYPGQE